MDDDWGYPYDLRNFQMNVHRWSACFPVSTPQLFAATTRRLGDSEDDEEAFWMVKQVQRLGRAPQILSDLFLLLFQIHQMS